MELRGVEERVRRTREELRRSRRRRRRARTLAPRRGRDTLAFAQGLYYLTTGVWPIVHMPSFLAVTGPKRDLWLVRTVGALITVVGGTLMLAARERRVTSEIRTMAVSGAAALTIVDMYYVARGTIPPIYLLDAVAEVGLMGAWGAEALHQRKRGGPRLVRARLRLAG